ncbi:MAG: hypothetical protein JWM68_1182 [Verrucomicrobiales bacterium]|nr:hypothetical protein [Verrucomicrobiales bacterium]
MFVEYKIIGGDGREYGPILLDEMKSWIREGRVSGTTLICRSDTQSWVPAAQFTEFQPEIGQSKAFMPTLAPGQSLFERVGFWPRLAAYIIDRVAMTIAFYAIWLVVANIFGWEQPTPPTTTKLDLILKFFAEEWAPFFVKQMVIALPLNIFYETFMNGRWGATLGKIVIGARIVRLDGSPIGYQLAFLRWLGERLSDLTCYIGYLFVAFRDDKRAMHDLIVGTQVIYKR